MSSQDIARIIEQEKQLVFKQFNAEAALALGLDIKKRIEVQGKAVSIDIRFWDRCLFAFAMDGTTADNLEWIRRKTNGVKRFHKSSYRMRLERGGDYVIKPFWGVDHDDYVFAGGSFPLQVEGIGCVGAITVSGLPERDDHGLVVEAICAAVGIEHSTLALPKAQS